MIAQPVEIRHTTRTREIDAAIEVPKTDMKSNSFSHETGPQSSRVEGSGGEEIA